MAILSESNQWIATDDNMPRTREYGEAHWIVFAMPGQPRHVLFAVWTGYQGHWESDNIPCDNAHISHWMPVIVPELPKLEEGSRRIGHYLTIRKDAPRFGGK